MLKSRIAQSGIRALLRWLAPLLLARVLFAAEDPPAPTHSLDDILAFELPEDNGRPDGWAGGPEETMTLDRKIVHGGTASGRIDRSPGSGGRFSTFTKSLPIDFQGSRIALKGWIRTQDVTEFAGLWMRLDGPSGLLEFDNMRQRQVRGTTGWTEYTVELPLNPDAREVFFGFLVGGNGRGWVDDLQLLVDGRPLRDAARVTRPDTIFDRDQEFTAGSRIALAELSPLQIQHLATLCRVWGFLKYHHPNVASGDHHWDFELFRVLPKALSTPDHPAFSAVLLEWVQRIASPKPTTERPGSDADVHLPADHQWFEHDATLSAPLRAALKNIHASRPQTAAQFYVSLTPAVKNPTFNHEADYRRIKFPDAGYQLLGLFRYWNIIRYWFPYRDLIEENWDDVLAEFIPRVGLANDADAYALQFMALITKVHDTHANLWSSLHLRPPVGDSQLPIAVRFIEGQMVVTHLLETAEGTPNAFLPGEVIRELDGVAIETLIETWNRSTPPQTNRPVCATSPAFSPADRRDRSTCASTARTTMSRLPLRASPHHP